MRPPLLAFVRWLPPILWMALIFIGSTDLLSATHTSRFIEPFLRWLSRGALSPSQIEQIHFLIRKAGHLCEYAVLCILFWLALPPSPHAHLADHPSYRSHWRRELLAVALAAVFAASDEFHQSFVPTRGASVHDVLIDTTGAILGLTFALAISRVYVLLRHTRIQEP